MKIESMIAKQAVPVPSPLYEREAPFYYGLMNSFQSDFNALAPPHTVCATVESPSPQGDTLETTKYFRALALGHSVLDGADVALFALPAKIIHDTERKRSCAVTFNMDVYAVPAPKDELDITDLTDSATKYLGGAGVRYTGINDGKQHLATTADLDSALRFNELLVGIRALRTEL